MGSIWITASGSGGTGKSSLSVALAATAARQGRKTLLLDAAGPWRTCDLYLGIQSLITLDLTDVMLNRLPIESAVYSIRGYSNFSYACTSLFNCIRLDEFSGLLLTLQGLYDLILIDLPTGEVTISPSFLKSEDRIILVTRPDPFALRACELLANQMHSYPAAVYPVINQQEHGLVRKRFQYTSETVSQILDCSVAGAIPRLPDFFTLRADGEKAALLSAKEQHMFSALYRDLMA
ncbi:MAG: AAA family ATPase [Clostridia bacterium]|nr:AAA family ATPase [Clostridia bacterium]